MATNGVQTSELRARIFQAIVSVSNGRLQDEEELVRATAAAQKQPCGTNNMQNQILKRVNKKLASPKHKKDGMEELKLFLAEMNDNIFTDNCVKWMQYCCMLNDMDSDTVNASLQVLRKLAESALKFPELVKPISNSVISRYADVFIKQLTNQFEAWKTLEALLWCYNGPFAHCKDTLQKLMASRINVGKISENEAKCYALLPSAGGGGTKGVIHRDNWSVAFSSIVRNCHAFLNELFKNIQELQVYETDITVDGQVPTNQLTIRLHNYSLILQAMLLGRYPSVKVIPAENVLDLVCRGLLVTGTYLGDSELATTAELRSAIPMIHNNLFKTLTALIVACSRTLLPCAGLIVRLIKQSLQSSSSASVRLSCYSCLINWLAVAGSGSCTDTLAKVLVPVLLGDIEYARPTVSLRGSNKNGESAMKAQVTSSELSESLCFAALEVLQAYLSAVGFLLSPDLHKTIQGGIIHLLTNLKNRYSIGEPIYGKSDRCRHGLYSILLQLCLEPSPKWPPPTQFAAKLFSVGREDPSPLVASTSSVALSILDRIIHPEFRVATFPTDYQTLLSSECKESSSSLTKANHLPESHNTSSEAFFRQFMDKPIPPQAKVADNANDQSKDDDNASIVADSRSSPIAMETDLEIDHNSVPNENDVAEALPTANVGIVHTSYVNYGEELVGKKLESTPPKKRKLISLEAPSTIEDLCNETPSQQSRSSGEFSSSNTLMIQELEISSENSSTQGLQDKSEEVLLDEELESTPKKQKLLSYVVVSPTDSDVVSIVESSQKSTYSDESSLPCSQMPKVTSQDSCTQELTQLQPGSEDTPYVVSSPNATQLEVIPEETGNLSRGSMSPLSVSSVSSHVEKLKEGCLEKTPDKKLNLRSNQDSTNVDSPMVLRSGAALLTPGTMVVRRTRRRAGSISSATSQSSRCFGGPVSPRSEIDDPDGDIIACFEDTLKQDD